MIDHPLVFLWADVFRPAPPGWVWARCVADALDVMKIEIVEAASLDSELDLCGDVGNGLALVHWMNGGKCWPMQKPIVHSTNKVARAAMLAVIDRGWKPGPNISTMSTHRFARFFRRYAA